MILPEQYIGLAEREGIIAAIDNMPLIRKIQYYSEKLDFFCNISSHTQRITSSSPTLSISWKLSPG